MLAYFLDMASLFKPPVEVDRVSLVSLDVLDDSVKKAIRLKYKDVKNVSLATSVILHGTKYSEGMFVSFGSTSGLPDFGKILKVLIVGKKASFIIECFSAWYLEHFRCYELTRTFSAGLQIADPEELNSFHGARKTDGVTQGVFTSLRYFSSHLIIFCFLIEMITGVN